MTKCRALGNNWSSQQTERKRVALYLPCICQLNISNLMKTIIFIGVFLFMHALARPYAGLRCPSNCTDCDQKSSVCFACSEGFSLTVMGTCVDSNIVPYCKLYGPTYQCFICEPTYTLSNGMCKKNYIPCLEQDPIDDFFCIRCGFGTVLQNKKCVGTINCVTPVNPCTACIYGFTLINGTCVDNTQNCLTRGDKGICITCKQRFILVGYSCLPKSLRVYQCRIYDEDGNCQVCRDGYILFEASCYFQSQIQQIKKERSSFMTNITMVNPKTWNEIKVYYDRKPIGNGTYLRPILNCKVEKLGQCLICNPGFQSVYGNCIQLKSSCLRRNQSNVCLKCRVGLLLTNGECKDPNCAEQADYTCLVCNPSFAVNAKNFCEYSDTNCLQPASTRCKKCAHCYFLNSKGLCFKMPTNCLEVDAFSQLCIKCKSGFKVNKQKQCESDQSVNGTLVPNCAVQNDDECLACLPKFYLNRNQNICLKDKNFINCRRGKLNTGNCQVCRTGFTLSKGGCIQSKPPAFCSKYNYQAGVCTACTSGYTLQYFQNSQVGTFICSRSPLAPPFPNIPHCTSYNGFLCTICLQSYYPYNGVCVPARSVCQTSGFDGRCLSCFPGYFLKGTNCFGPDGLQRNCVQQDAEGYCTACEQNFFLNVNKNCQTKDINCKKYTNGTCSECKEKLFLFDERCLLFQPFLDIRCMELDWQKKVCKECLNGLTPKGLKCE